MRARVCVVIGNDSIIMTNVLNFRIIVERFSVSCVIPERWHLGISEVIRFMCVQIKVTNTRLCFSDQRGNKNDLKLKVTLFKKFL